MKSKSGLKKQRKFHYLLGLTENQKQQNITALNEWLEKNRNEYQDGIEVYTRQLESKKSKDSTPQG